MIEYGVGSDSNAYTYRGTLIASGTPVDNSSKIYAPNPGIWEAIRVRPPKYIERVLGRILYAYRSHRDRNCRTLWNYAKHDANVQRRNMAEYALKEK